jgi:hypothetical protein
MGERRLGSSSSAKAALNKLQVKKPWDAQRQGWFKNAMDRIRAENSDARGIVDLAYRVTPMVLAMETTIRSSARGDSCRSRLGT